MIYSFVIDDSLTSWRFTTRTKRLTTCKCCEPLEWLRVRLGTRLVSNFILLIVPRRYFCGGSYCFMSLCCLRLMCVYIFVVLS